MNIRWDNGRLIHADYDDVYFHPTDGMGESIHVFLKGNELARRFEALRPGDVFVIGEAGFGVGRNFLSTWRLFAQRAPKGAVLHYHAFEYAPPPFAVAAKALAPFPALSERLAALSSSWPLSIPGCAPVWVGDPAVCLKVWVGDIADRLPETQFVADAWFLDGFSPAKNPDMWSDEVFAAIAQRSHAQSTLATYSAAGWVRRGLQAAGFAPRRVSGFGGKRHMVVATRTDATPPPHPKPPLRYPTPPRAPVGAIAVIGAGIAGASMARALADAGHDVTVFERNTVAGGASGNPLGLLQPLPNLGNSPIGDWYSRAFVWSRAMAARLQLPWDACGVHRHPTSPKKARYAQRLVEEVGWPGVLSLHDDVLHIAHAAIIEPVEWCKQLLDHPRIVCRTNTAVTALHDGPPWTLHGMPFTHVVLANSAAAAQLSPGLPLRWVRGQMGWVASTARSAAQTPALCHEGYLLPARNGQHIVGATYTPEDTDTTWRPNDWQTLLSRLATHLPTHSTALGNPPQHVGGRVALRGVTPGRLPFVGPAIVPGAIEAAWQVHGGDGRPLFGTDGLRPGVWCSLGHGSRGLSSGPLAGAVLTEMMLGMPLSIPMTLATALHPARACLHALRHRQPLPV